MLWYLMVAVLQKELFLLLQSEVKIHPLRIDVRANTEASYPRRLILSTSRMQIVYMTLYNEACRNDGIADTDMMLLLFITLQSGANPYRYPDMSFYSS